MDKVKRKITIKYGIFEEISDEKVNSWIEKTEKYKSLDFPTEKAGLTAAVLIFGTIGRSRRNSYLVQEILDDFNSR